MRRAERLRWKSERVKSGDEKWSTTLRQAEGGSRTWQVLVHKLVATGTPC